MSGVLGFWGMKMVKKVNDAGNRQA